MKKKATFKFRNRTYTVTQNEHVKKVSGPGYNCKTDLCSGYTERWGDTREEDPVMAPWPEIADIEAHRGCLQGCKFCYKGNTPFNNHSMSVEDAEKVIRALSIETSDGWISPVSQIAFGITDNTRENILPIFNLARQYGIVPNVTTNGFQLTEPMIKEWGQVLGAVAVSNYGEICLDTVEAFTRLTNLKTNIHQLLSEDTYDQCMDILEKRATDPRLKNMYAIVFLTLKQKGRGHNLAPLTDFNKYKKLIEKAFSLGVPFGFDSCGCGNFMKAIADHPNAKQFIQSVDACESLLFSIYANEASSVYPCSFNEGNLGWWNPPKLTEVTNFVEEVWDTPQANIWRNNLLHSTSHQSCQSCNVKSHCRSCPSYNLDLCRR